MSDRNGTYGNPSADWLMKRVVMARDNGDCAVVSNLGRVTWHGEAFQQYIQGGSHG